MREASEDDMTDETTQHQGVTMHKFRKRPVEIEAFQITKATLLDNSEWPNWLHRAWNGERDEPVTIRQVYPDTYLPGVLEIVTPAGTSVVSLGDWIIRGALGETYSCAPDVFEAAYAPVNDDTETT